MREKKQTILIASETPVLSNDWESFPCGCRVAVGVRVDNRETAMAMSGCILHKSAMKRAQIKFFDHPPCNRHAMELFLELFEAEKKVETL